MFKLTAAFLLAAHLAQGFPFVANELTERGFITQKAALAFSKKECNTGLICSKDFDAEKQFVDVRPGSANEWKAPGKHDLRGECPGLNAAANHGFLPRNGLTTIEQTIFGLSKAYSMSLDLSSFLAAVSVALSGDYLTETWSIGGPFKSSVPLLLAKPQGLTGTHNKYEGDASFSRYDAYLNDGDAGTLRMASFKKFYNTGEEYTFDTMRQHNLYVANYSLHNNPYYFSAPFAGLVTPAAHEFIINFMSNHSASRPGGYLNRQMLKDFFAITGEGDDLKWTEGHERIPMNWYKRPLSNTYSAEKNVFDTSITGLAYPGTVRIGGNTGKVNSFVGVDIGKLTGGSFNEETLLQGNNLGCFFVQAFTAGLPDQLSGFVKDIKPILKLVNKYGAPLTDKFKCAPLKGFETSLFNIYPGYKHPKKHS